MQNIFDCLIIGGGPAGITAGIYLRRAGKKVAILEKFVPGGQVSQAGEIENYTGFSKITGAELAQKFYDHALSLGVEFIFEEALELDLSKKIKKVITKKHSYLCKSLVLAVGCKTRELNIKGEQEFKGKGVSYCAVCDGNFYKGKTVAVIGSGDSAISDAKYLSSICKTVYILNKHGFVSHALNAKEVDSIANIKILSSAMSCEILGKDKVEKLVYQQGDKRKELKVDGIFVAIGRTADTGLLQGKLQLNEKGYILVDENLKTSADGVYACGDDIARPVKQITAAVGDGAIVAAKIIAYLA